MKRKILVWSGLMAFLAPLAAGIGMNKVSSPKVLPREEGLKTAIQCDKAVLKNPDFLGEPLMYVLTRKEEAWKDLAKNESALAGLQNPPKLSQTDIEKIRIARLERAIRKDKACIRRPGEGTVQKLLTLRTIKTQAQKKLVLHKARLNELQTAQARTFQGRLASLMKKVERKLT